jgi:hypothetical protein
MTNAIKVLLKMQSGFLQLASTLIRIYLMSVETTYYVPVRNATCSRKLSTLQAKKKTLRIAIVSSSWHVFMLYCFYAVILFFIKSKWRRYQISNL